MLTAALASPSHSTHEKPRRKLLDAGATPLIKFEHVDVFSPGGKLLLKDLSFDIPEGGHIIIEGEWTTASHCGCD